MDLFSEWEDVTLTTSRFKWVVVSDTTPLKIALKLTSASVGRCQLNHLLLLGDCKEK